MMFRLLTLYFYLFLFTFLSQGSKWRSVQASHCLDEEIKEFLVNSFWKTHHSNKSTILIIALTVVIWIFVIIIVILEFGIHYLVIGMIEKRRAKRRAI